MNKIQLMTTNLNRPIATAIIIVSASTPTAAQLPSPPINYDNPVGIAPAMLIVFVTIVSIILLIGCLSIYARHCVDYGSLPSHDYGNALLPSWSCPSIDGLDPAVIGSFPTFVYSEVKGLKIGKGTLECAVCLSEFDEVDTLRLLPKCCHVFHQDCIDTWLYSKVTCPVCRAFLIPRPGETSNFVVPIREPEDDTNSYYTSEDDIIINICSSKPANSNPTPKCYLSPRSKSSKRQLFDNFIGNFRRSFTTGHVLVRSDDYSRFTLRLPWEVRRELMHRSKSHNQSQTKSGVVFPRVRSERNGYRSASVEGLGATYGGSPFNYERVKPEEFADRYRFTRTLSVFSRTGSMQLPNRVGEDSGAQLNGNTSKSLSRSLKSMFQFRLNGSIKEDVEIPGNDR